MRISAGLTGFSGELLRNARARERSDVGESRCRFLCRYSVCSLAVEVRTSISIP